MVRTTWLAAALLTVTLPAAAREPNIAPVRSLAARVAHMMQVPGPSAGFDRIVADHYAGLSAQERETFDAAAQHPEYFDVGVGMIPRAKLPDDIRKDHARLAALSQAERDWALAEYGVTFAAGGQLAAKTTLMMAGHMMTHQNERTIDAFNGRP